MVGLAAGAVVAAVLVLIGVSLVLVGFLAVFAGGSITALIELLAEPATADELAGPNGAELHPPDLARVDSAGRTLDAIKDAGGGFGGFGGSD
jgi:hypothetical protein